MRGSTTIEAALAALIILLILELWVSTLQQWPTHLYQFLEGSPTCDIDCLLAPE
jgi:uncharacterized membrane protein YcaP (DUF421 family)